MIRRKRSGVLDLARRELAKEKNEKVVLSILLGITLVCVSILLFFLSTHFINVGYASYLESRAGTVTQVNIHQTVSTLYWHGVYGLALGVSGFMQQLYTLAGSGTITRQDIFFNCLQPGVKGGDLVFASTSRTINFANLQPASPSAVDTFTGCNSSVYDQSIGSNHVDCAVNTFTSTMSIIADGRNISGIPSTYTYRYDGNNTIFSLGLLTDGSNLVYVTQITNIQSGYSPNLTVNYQMLLPTNPNFNSTYYFFTDPSYVCPAGGIGQVINSSVYGYIRNSFGLPVSNVTISVAGKTIKSNINGFYNLSFSAVGGVHNLFAFSQNYDPYYTNITTNFSSYNVPLNITLKPKSPGLNQTIQPFVSGYARDAGTGSVLSGVQVYLGTVNTTTGTNGYYSFNPILTPGQNPLAAIKTGYENYYSLLNFSPTTTNISYNFSMTSVSTYTFPFQTGPYAQPPNPVQPPVQKAGQDYWISTSKIDVQVRQNTFIQQTISLYDFKSTPMNVVFSIPSDLQDFIKISQSSVTVEPNSFANVVLTIYGTRPIGNYSGIIGLSGDLTNQVPISVQVVDNNFPVQTLLSQINLFQNVIPPGSNLTYSLNLQNLLRDQSYQVFINATVKDANGKVYAFKTDEAEINNALTLIERIPIPPSAPEGDYRLDVGITYLNYFIGNTASFVVQKPLYLYAVFGIPLWMYFAMIAFMSFIFLNLFLYGVYKRKKQRYSISLDYGSLPKPGSRVIKLGLVAETKHPAYYEIDKLTTHAIVAGATGMGKSISAQVMIEEALLNNVAVIVFDPTAQWSGMLRKCTDKRMLSYYPSFGLKEGDARAFKGNVREIKDAREYVDVKKYMNPGQIQILSLNKLQPKDIDIFVANVIRGIFQSDPKEAPDLKLLLVFDEVHRLLAKFGGSGEGFLQVERACREFRKWGMGVMLISQVLADFVGEIKANISTEVQMRTRDEGDLNRIKTKYGEDFLRSLVKASVGVGMFVNPAYNHGKPYFVNFRPILHNTRRLSDEELEKYNHYNDLIDELEDQIAQLEELKVDTFDFKMEIKLMKDKIMTGNFSVVEIYLEGLKPRVEKEWQRLGKKPKARQLRLISQEEINKSLEEAKKSRSDFEKAEAAKAPKEEAKEAPKENIDLKIVNPLTFDNGIMLSSLKELKDVLPTLDDDVFKTHVNENKNDIAKWISENFSPEDGKLVSLTDKSAMVKALAKVGKNTPKAAVKAAPANSASKEESGKAPGSKKTTAKKSSPVKRSVKGKKK